MSVELCFTDGNVVCDFGVIEHGDPRPDRNEVGHLILATREWIAELINSGPRPHYSGALHSVTYDGDRLFGHVDYWGRRWTWELFEAHFSDGKGPEIYIGRWPD